MIVGNSTGTHSLAPWACSPCFWPLSSLNWPPILFGGVTISTPVLILVAFDFRALQSSEVRKLYTGNLDRNRKKIDHLIEIKNRQCDNAEEIATLFGVKVGDKELGEHEDKPANVWGKAEVGDEAKEVLNLGKKFRIHQRLDSIANRTEIEKRFDYCAMERERNGR